MKSKHIIDSMYNAHPVENRLHTCYSHHVAAIVSGHRTRAMDANIPGKHAEIAAIEKFARTRNREKCANRESRSYVQWAQ